MGHNEDMSLAHRLADEAGRIAMSWFRGPFTSRTKADGSLVTEADEAVEDAVRAILTRSDPTTRYSVRSGAEQVWRSASGS